MRISPFVTVAGIDKFFRGKGILVIKLLSFIAVADAKGEECDQAELVHYLNEMTWFLSAFLSGYIHLEPINSESAKATIRVHDLTASEVLYFSQKGQMTNFVAERYMGINRGAVLNNWSTRLKQYAEINRIMVLVKGEGVWTLDIGDLCDIKISGITDIEYNNPTIY